MRQAADEKVTWTIPEYAKGIGISERTARRLLAEGQVEGVVRVGSRVLVIKQHVIDQLLRAAGVDPHPELEADEAAEAAESRRVAEYTEKSDREARKEYHRMLIAREDLELARDYAAVHGL